MMAHQHTHEPRNPSPLRQSTDHNVTSTREHHRDYGELPQSPHPRPSPSSTRSDIPHPQPLHLKRKPDPYGQSFSKRMEGLEIGDGMKRRPTHGRSRQGLGEAQAGLRRQQNTIGRGSGLRAPRQARVEDSPSPAVSPEPGLSSEELTLKEYKTSSGEDELRQNDTEAGAPSSKHRRVDESSKAPDAQSGPSTRPQDSATRTSPHHNAHRAARLSSYPPPQPNVRKSSLPRQNAATSNPNRKPSTSQRRPQNDQTYTQSQRRAPSSAAKGKETEIPGRTALRGLVIANPDPEPEQTSPRRPNHERTTAEIERDHIPSQDSIANPSPQRERLLSPYVHNQRHAPFNNNLGPEQTQSQNTSRDQRNNPVAGASQQPQALPLPQQNPARDAADNRATNAGSSEIPDPARTPVRNPRDKTRRPRNPVPDNPIPDPNHSHEPPKKPPHECYRDIPYKYSNLRACSHRYIPIFFGILFVGTTTFVFIYTLNLHRALPPKTVEWIWGAFGVLILAGVLCNLCLCKRMKKGSLRCARFTDDVEKYQEGVDSEVSSFKRWRRGIEEKHYECMRKRHEEHAHKRTTPMNHTSKILRWAPNEDRRSEMTPPKLPEGTEDGRSSRNSDTASSRSQTPVRPASAGIHDRNGPSHDENRPSYIHDPPAHTMGDERFAVNNNIVFKVFKKIPGSNEWRDTTLSFSRLWEKLHKINGGGGFAPKVAPEPAAELADENLFSDMVEPLPITHPSYLSHALSSFNASLYSNSNEILPKDVLQRFAEFMAQDRNSASPPPETYDFAWYDLNRAAHMSRGSEVTSCESGPGFGLPQLTKRPQYGIPQLKELRPQSPFENPLPCPIPDEPLKCTLSDRIEMWEKEESVVGDEGLGDDLGTASMKKEEEIEAGLWMEEGNGRTDSPTRGYDDEPADQGQLWPRFGAYGEDELPERTGKGVGALKVSVVGVKEGRGSE